MGGILGRGWQKPDEWLNGNRTNCGAYLSSPSVASAVAVLAVVVVFVIIVAGVACMQNSRQGEG